MGRFTGSRMAEDLMDAMAPRAHALDVFDQHRPRFLVDHLGLQSTARRSGLPS